MNARNRFADRRYFIGGSDARIIMGDDEAALLRLWQEKRGEIEPEDLSGNLIVQLGLVTQDLNRRWYQANSGGVLTDIERRIRHPALRWMAATLDGRIEATGAVFEAKFMLPWSFSGEPPRLFGVEPPKPRIEAVVSARLLRRWPRHKPNSSIPRSHWWVPSGPMELVERNGHSVMRHSPAGLRSCARR